MHSELSVRRSRSWITLSALDRLICEHQITFYTSAQAKVHHIALLPRTPCDSVEICIDQVAIVPLRPSTNARTRKSNHLLGTASMST